MTTSNDIANFENVVDLVKRNDYVGFYDVFRKKIIENLNKNEIIQKYKVEKNKIQKRKNIIKQANRELENVDKTF